VDFHSWIPSDDECVEDAFLGELQVTVQHIALSEELVVRVKRGRNLLMRGPAVNPYVKVSLAPDPTKKYSFKTEVKVRSTDPVFDESITFAKVTERDTERKILKIAAFDDLNLNPYIGEINIKLNRIGLDLTVPRWIALRKDLRNPLSPPPPSSSLLFSSPPPFGSRLTDKRRKTNRFCWATRRHSVQGNGLRGPESAVETQGG